MRTCLLLVTLTVLIAACGGKDGVPGGSDPALPADDEVLLDMADVDQTIQDALADEDDDELFGTTGGELGGDLELEPGNGLDTGGSALEPPPKDEEGLPGDDEPLLRDDEILLGEDEG